MVSSSLIKKLFFPLLFLTALPGLLPGSAFSQISLTGKQFTVFSGSLEDAVKTAPVIAIARPLDRQFSASPTDSPMQVAFKVKELVKGSAPEILDIHMPGQTMAFYPSADKDYLIFLSGRRDGAYAILSHSLQTVLAFEIGDGDAVAGRLPRDWKPFTVSQVRELIRSAGHQSD
ncbi:hypothetical protein [Emcibacter nanhaiensis]|uniref:Uncharacterized protein n=1 Tax=Emcibacter nanhaiensis TaxID=1505037 RepID=A0A501PTD3_9PROT|nr:hypothetical protein [Emcibacter nanhaiensis]TPD63016.1 hypothetical protein FIV46_02750 [Emcibacter nanhaiensis]